ncbi:MAG: alpha/beta fold hydrolase [Actinobacteria bacterium]|nr:alpha/beta fold hydrolase [Actinomycetota bacterium]
MATLALVVSWVGTAGAAERIGTTFPEDFPEILDASLGVPVIGFGASGAVERAPVIFLHGNNDTPYPTACNGSFGHMQAFAQHFLDHGYRSSELWGLGYQGDQCDALADPTVKSSAAHSTLANVPDVRAFVQAVLDYTGAEQVDIVGHSLGGIVPREWLRQDDAYASVRRLVAVDSPHHGIINCSPSLRNYYANPAAGGFHPDSAICREFGAADTPLLSALNAGDATPGPTEYLSVRNIDTSFVYVEAQDGAFPPVPAEDRHGRPHDFSASGRLEGARDVGVVGQGRHDPALGTAHIGISNSPEVWQLTLDFLSSGPSPAPMPAPEATASVRPHDGTAARAGALPATGGGAAGLASVLLAAALWVTGPCPTSGSRSRRSAGSRTSTRPGRATPPSPRSPGTRATGSRPGGGA